MIEVFRRFLYVYEKIDIPVEYVIVFLIFALSLILDNVIGEVRKLREDKVVSSRCLASKVLVVLATLLRVSSLT